MLLTGTNTNFSVGNYGDGLSTSLANIKNPLFSNEDKNTLASYGLSPDISFGVVITLNNFFLDSISSGFLEMSYIKSSTNS